MKKLICALLALTLILSLAVCANAAGSIQNMRHLGGSYSGAVENNLPHGEGTIYWGNCSYRGDFVRGYPQGSGVFTFADGTCQLSNDWSWTQSSYRSWVPSRQGADMYYTGMTHCGTPCGFGTLNFSSGGSYLGEFENGDPQGWGIYTYRSPSSEAGKYLESSSWTTVYDNYRLEHSYTGLKIGSQWQGFGIGIKNSGYAYCGEIKNDYRDGHGELYTASDKLETWGIYRSGSIQTRYQLP